MNVDTNTKKRTREEMEDSSTNGSDSAKRRRLDEDKSSENPATGFAAVAATGFSQFSSGGFQSFASSNGDASSEAPAQNSFSEQMKSFSNNFSWGQSASEPKKLSFGNNNFDWANKDFKFGSANWGEGKTDEDKEKMMPSTPTKPREGEIAGVAADAGDTDDTTVSSTVATIFRLEKVPAVEAGGGLEGGDSAESSATSSPAKTKTKYVEKGEGEVRINTYVEPESQKLKARLLCRRARVMKTILNAPILPQSDEAGINEFLTVNESYVKFSVIENVDGEAQLATYLIRPKEKDALADFHMQILAAQERVSEQEED